MTIRVSRKKRRRIYKWWVQSPKLFFSSPFHPAASKIIKFLAEPGEPGYVDDTLMLQPPILFISASGRAQNRLTDSDPGWKRGGETKSEEDDILIFMDI
jgi:hypothetical protein